MADGSDTRDILAERILRLERRIEDLGKQIGTTSSHVERAGEQLDALVGLVGRLSHVVDVQGESLQGDENQLGEKLGEVEGRVGDLTHHLQNIASRLDSLGNKTRTDSDSAAEVGARNDSSRDAKQRKPAKKPPS